jgi:hypothetical protein
MTVPQAEEILLKTGVKVAVQQRFAFDSGTLLRLDNYAIVNIFDDGRYYIQGQNTDALVIAFGLVEQAWDPDAWNGEMPNHAPKPAPIAPPVLGPLKRFDF